MLTMNFKVHKWRVKINILMLKSGGSTQSNLGETKKRKLAEPGKRD